MPALPKAPSTTRRRTGTATAAQAAAKAPLDVEKIRRDFPILGTTARGKPLVYLDSAATSQKPRAVIEAITRFYERENGNIHRGVHYLSERATELYDQTRSKAKKFFNARRDHEIIFTRGTTEGINLVASSFGKAFVRAGDEIVVTAMEHHSNIVPWQMLCERIGARLAVVPVLDNGDLDVGTFERLLNAKTKLVAVTHVSNALGTINPVKQMISLAHAKRVPVLIDGAQSAPHMAVDVQALDCDFYVCSGHKMLGPTGVGILYGKESWLDRMPPYQGGGDMIETVSFERTTYARLPNKFEAGTPDIAAVVGFGAALDYLTGIGLDTIAAHEHQLLSYATKRIKEVPGVTLIGKSPNKAGVVSFTMADAHPHDIGTILDGEGIAIRAGHHCAQPLMKRFGVPATARASFYLYNTTSEVDALVAGLHRVNSLFG